MCDRRMRWLVLSLAVAVVGCHQTHQAKPELVTRASEPLMEPASKLCELEEDWALCRGRQVQVEGVMARMVMQHPHLEMGLDGEVQEQFYMDVDGAGQIILLSEERPVCLGAMVVKGFLEEVDLGGEPGTKASYKNWYLRNISVVCK